MSNNYYDSWKSSVQERSKARSSMFKMGWVKYTDRGRFGWYRKTREQREIIVYTLFNGEESSMAHAWGWDLARKNLPRSFVEQIAGDHGGLFAVVFLKGFDDFHRPAKIERVLLDYELEALR